MSNLTINDVEFFDSSDIKSRLILAYDKKEHKFKHIKHLLENWVGPSMCVGHSIRNMIHFSSEQIHIMSWQDWNAPVLPKDWWFCNECMNLVLYEVFGAARVIKTGEIVDRVNSMRLRKERYPKLVRQNGFYRSYADVVKMDQ